MATRSHPASLALVGLTSPAEKPAHALNLLAQQVTVTHLLYLDLALILTCLLAGYADLDDNVSTPCELCPDGSFTTEQGQAECQAWSICMPGYQAVNDSASAISDRQCTACPEKYFSSTNTTAEACQPWHNCSPGSFVTTEPSATVDRLCQACSIRSFANTENAASCENRTLCAPGFFEAISATLSSDNQCRLCFPNTFQAGFGGKVCQPWTLCDLGYEQATVPTRVRYVPRLGSMASWLTSKDTCRDGTCRMCVLGATYRSDLKQEACQSVTQCNPGYTELESATISNDRLVLSAQAILLPTTNRPVLPQCKACRLGENFKSTRGSFPCSPVGACPAGQREVASPTLSSDRQV